MRLDVAEGLSPAPGAILPVQLNPQRTCIGIAPFARHAAKMYPVAKMKEVVKQLAAHTDLEIILLGSRKEAAQMQDWEQLGNNIQNLAGRFGFAEELAVIARLDILISMDSANMHLASMYGVPVVSIWGAHIPGWAFMGGGRTLPWQCKPICPVGLLQYLVTNPVRCTEKRDVCRK